MGFFVYLRHLIFPIILGFVAVTTDGFVQEVFGAYTLTNGMQITGFYKRDFDNKLNTFRAGLTIFL